VQGVKSLGILQNAQMPKFGHLGGIYDQYENAHWAFGHSGINFDLANSAQICGHSKLTISECLCDADGHSSTYIQEIDHLAIRKQYSGYLKFPEIWAFGHLGENSAQNQNAHWAFGHLGLHPEIRTFSKNALSGAPPFRSKTADFFEQKNFFLV